MFKSNISHGCTHAHTRTLTRAQIHTAYISARILRVLFLSKYVHTYKLILVNEKKREKKSNNNNNQTKFVSLEHLRSRAR